MKKQNQYKHIKVSKKQW